MTYDPMTGRFAAPDAEDYDAHMRRSDDQRADQIAAYGEAHGPYARLAVERDENGSPCFVWYGG